MIHGHGYPTARTGRRAVKASRLHGTACICGRLKKVWQVACAACWSSLPAELRSRIWRLYKNKETRGGDEHRAAVFEATALIRKGLKQS